MTTLRLSLRAGERIFINGAVMRVDRKTTIELMNDATFLLESHVMQAADATTPLRQLYFIVQMMLIDPADAAAAREAFDRIHPMILAAFSNPGIRDGLLDVADLVERQRAFDALKCLRVLIPIEDLIISGHPPVQPEPRPAPAPIAVGARS